MLARSVAPSAIDRLPSMCNPRNVVVAPVPMLVSAIGASYYLLLYFRSPKGRGCGLPPLGAAIAA